MFAREGYVIIGVALVLSIALALVAMRLNIGWRIPLLVVAVLVLGFTLYFFRDPIRNPPVEASGGDLLLAPADGRVLLVQEVAHEPLFIKGPARQISIFLSPLNVHVNRIPADGTISFERYVPGEYLVAWHPKSSEKNERSEIGMIHENGTPVLFKQIAGAVARRIVYHVRVGDRVKAGDRFGIVKFGSRMDILVPPHVVITAKVGDKTVAGVTVMGRIPAPPTPEAEP